MMIEEKTKQLPPFYKTPNMQRPIIGSYTHVLNHTKQNFTKDTYTSMVIYIKLYRVDTDKK
jgi:hypothetical protein